MNSEEKIKIEFNKKIQSEVEEFRKRMTNESSEYVYSACEKVCFVETLYDMLFCTNISSDAKNIINFDVIKWLNDKEKPLEFLYQEFEKEKCAFSKNWDELIDVIECLYLFEENERLKSQLKEQEAIRKLAEGCIYDIEDALYRGDKNDRASEAIDEFEEKVKELKGE